MYKSEINKEVILDEYTKKLVQLATDIAKTASNEDKDYFISGGLAIDFSVGKITRNHHDIDFHPALKDTSWWINWFENRGLVVNNNEDSHFPETYKVIDGDEEVVDLWPMDLKNGILLINYDGKYVDAGRHWDEIRVVNFQDVNIKVENPLRVLEQKTRHANQGEPLREQDIHDFKLLENNSPLTVS